METTAPECIVNHLISKTCILQYLNFRALPLAGLRGSLKYKKNNTKMYTQEEADDLLTNFSA